MVLWVLESVERGRRLDLALGRVPSSPSRAWIQELTYGVVRLRGRLDFLLDRHLRKGIGSLPAPVRWLLRMGAYQAFHMGAVPAYAAVSETVAAVRHSKWRGLSGLTNAVLRRVVADGEGEDLFPSADRELEAYLSTWGSHPGWMVRRWLARNEPEAVAEWIRLANQVPTTCARPFGGTVRDASAGLRREGIAHAAPVPSTSCIPLPRGVDVGRALAAMHGFVQDPAAALVSEFARPAEGVPVADLCAAPGGKTLALADAGHTVWAGDASRVRLRLLEDNVRRLDAHNVHLVQADAGAPPFTELPAVLLDAPCTGTGTLARHPDVRWKLSEQRLADLVGVQARLLDGVAQAVRPGGLLVYATCSLEEEENEEQVRRFLARHPDYSLESDPRAPESRSEPTCLRLTPDATGYDGAFAARLRRKR